jgi:hypothetical protein
MNNGVSPGFSQLAPGTLWLRKWKLDVFSTQTTLTPNPLGPPQPGVAPLPSSGELHLTLTHPAGIEGSLTQDLDLSQMRITFDITAADARTPNLAVIKVWNVSDQTANVICNNFVDGLPKVGTVTKVRLQAGYQNGPMGIIFEGEVLQSFRGRESATDSFVLIHAGDADTWFAYSTSFASLAADTDLNTAFRQIMQNATHTENVTWPDNLPTGPQGIIGGIFPRGQVLWGATRDLLDMVARQSGCTWSVQQGKLTLIPVDASLPGEAIELNSATGLLDIPIRTQQGIRCKTLIRPEIQVGRQVRLNNRFLNQQLINVTAGTFSGGPNATPTPLYDRENFLAHIDTDGLYRVLCIDATGDTRGDRWDYVLTLLSLDPPTGVPLDVAQPGATVTLGQPFVQPSAP